MGMFGSSGSAMPYVPPQHSLPAMVLNALGRNVLGVDYLGRQDRLQALGNLQQANSAAAGLFNPAPGAPRQMPVANSDGQDITDAFGPQMVPGSPHMRSASDIAAGLAHLSMVPGFNAKSFKDLAAYAQPDITQGSDDILFDKKSGQTMGRLPHHQVVNGYNVDLGAPDAPGYVPTLPNGTIPDGRGGVRNLSGLPQALAAQEAARVGAQEGVKAGYVYPNSYNAAAGTGAGGAPFALENTNVNGVPTTMSRAQALGLAGGGGSGQPQPPAFSVATAANALASLAPGAQITSTVRSPARNSAAGGVPNSMHLNANAIDFVPPKGMTADAFKARLAQAGLPVTELIDEGSHIHWGWGQKGQAQATPAPAPTRGFHGINPADEKAVQGYLDAAKQAEDVAGLGHQFMKLNGTTATGPGYSPLDVPIPFSHGGEINLNLAAPVMSKLHTNVPAMDNLSMQMALGQRAPGQRITQFEIQKNLSTVPNKEHMGNQNSAIVSDYDNRAVQRRAYANFAQDYLAQNGSLTGLDQAWRAHQGQAGRSRAAGPRVRTYNPKTGNLE